MSPVSGRQALEYGSVLLSRTSNLNVHFVRGGRALGKLVFYCLPKGLILITNLTGFSITQETHAGRVHLRGCSQKV